MQGVHLHAGNHPCSDRRPVFCALEYFMNRYAIEFDREDDGRWIAEIPILPGVMAYGASQQEAKVNVEILALRVTADRMESEHETIESVQFACA